LKERPKMKCPKCIFDNPEGAKFCIECGHKFGEELARPLEGTTECIAKLHEAGIVVGYDTGYTRDASTALR
jgi:hypothetical protein